MITILTLLATLTFSTLVTRVAAVALMLTGLSRETARFQARSAFYGVGFTTSEAEMIVGHPVRRKIVMMLMILGNVGLVMVAATLILSVMSVQGSSWTDAKVWLFGGGLIALIVLVRSRRLEDWIARISSHCLCQLTELDRRDHLNLLHLPDGHGVAEVALHDKHPLVGKTIAEARTERDGVRILGVQSHAGYASLPAGESVLQSGTTLVLYGPARQISALGADAASATHQMGPAERPPATTPGGNP